jgi:hypothetical protein
VDSGGRGSGRRPPRHRRRSCGGPSRLRRAARPLSPASARALAVRLVSPCGRRRFQCHRGRHCAAKPPPRPRRLRLDPRLVAGPRRVLLAAHARLRLWALTGRRPSRSDRDELVVDPSVRAGGRRCVRGGRDRRARRLRSAADAGSVVRPHCPRPHCAPIRRSGPSRAQL